jgi:predicted nuclease of predicted toxin-antitoxin system
LKVLLDECLDRRIIKYLSTTDVFTVPQMGWAGKKNGELLRLAEVEFGIFVTADRHLAEQQNLSSSKMAIVVLAAPSNSLKDLLPLLSSLERALTEARLGTVITIES